MANLRRDVEKLQHKHSEELPLQAPGAFEYDVTLVQSHREDIQGELNSRLVCLRTRLALLCGLIYKSLRCKPPLLTFETMLRYSNIKIQRIHGTMSGA